MLTSEMLRSCILDLSPMVGNCAQLYLRIYRVHPDLPFQIRLALASGFRLSDCLGRTWSHRRRSSGSAAGTPCRRRRTRCPPRCTGCRRTRPAPTSSAARAEASRRVRAGESASPRERGAGRECRRPRRCRDHHVVGLHQVTCCSRSARMIRAAASIRARWENAWGKLPRWRPVAASNSSA